MSRTVKRVPLDFDHPLNEVWPGYLAPSLDRCKACDGSGETTAMGWMNTLGMLLSVLGEDVARAPGGHQLHPYASTIMNRPTERWNKDRPANWQPATLRPSPDFLDFLAGITGRPAESFTDGLFGTSHYTITAALIEKAGLPEKWGWCANCDGTGQDGTAEQRAALEAYDNAPEGAHEPPTGEGWQLWETTSEGSPVTPVFATKEELAAHLASPEYTYGRGSENITMESAMAMVESGWAPTFTFAGGKLRGPEESALMMKDQD